MAQQKGSTVDLLIGFESTFGTAPTAGFQVPVNTFGLRANRVKNTPATLTGTRNPAAPFDGNLVVSGPLVVPLDSAAMIYWCAAMFGDPTSSGADPYVHEFKIADSMPSFTLEAAFEDLATAEYNQFRGCKVSSFGITVGGDGELVANIDIAGANESLESASFDGTPTAVTLARVNNFNAAIEEGGAALSIATELSMDINFGLDLEN